ncbi:MMPL family transporter [Clostridium sp. MSJ-8]|uniref:efflux RND transporter permease subunit n=1 Tax=Clostridium sp. MSJ-8 TaxID=2841510 RepID=UPI001C0E93CE|nr:MMPL family transporter [Clostridium sp. MSJ-8]MBU5486811.1 MMPL family transporter [Clostridium sp. MSJ-8]
MRKFSRFIAYHAKAILIIALILLVPSVIGYANTRINYDILSYLPSNLDSMKGQSILEDVYQDASIGIVVVDGMEAQDIVKLKEKINKVDGVDTSLGIDDVLDTSVPSDILPDEIRTQLYNGDSTMFIIKFSGGTADDSTMDAIDKVRSIMNKQCFLSGMSSIVRDTKEIAEGEAPFYVLVAVLISLAILFISMESTAVPVIFMLAIGIGIIYNLGSNIFLGQISYITKALAAVLQLGVTMDYSIFLMHRYDEELKSTENRKDAIANAIQATMVSITGSSLTTVAGFLALCTMVLALGKDIGLVMAKGVILGVICSITVLPSFILIFDKLIHRFKHRTILPDFKNAPKIVTRFPRLFVLLFFIILIPAVIGNNNVNVYYNLTESLPKDMDSIVALNKMKKEFNMTTTHFILVDDSIEPYRTEKMVKDLEGLDGMTSVIAYDKFIGPVIPEDFLPDDVKDIFKQGGYNLIIANSSYKAATDEENNQIDKMNKIIKSYDKNGKIAGEGALTKDLVEIADVDFKNVSIVSILAIFIIILLIFKSITIPIILVSVIELAIFINMGIPYYTGTVIPFIASIVIGTIQLGATVDYAILMTSRFKEELENGHDKKEAVKIAVLTSTKSIVTSGLTFFGATAAVALVSDMELISSLCVLISRGAIISMLVIIFILPSFLLVFEGVIRRTTIGWPKKKEVAQDANRA